VNLGTDNRNKTILAAVVGVLAVLAIVYEIGPMLTGSGAPVAASQPVADSTAAPRPATQRRGPAAAKRVLTPGNLDPTLQLQLLAASEQIKYAGSGRNIFVSQAEPPPKPLGNGTTDHEKGPSVYVPPAQAGPPPIPLKFFGFSNKPGEPKKIFLVLGEDVFIAGEGEIVDRRYKVIRISPTSVEIQDVVISGPPQSIPLTQG
jgi:hypothetical protein